MTSLLMHEGLPGSVQQPSIPPQLLDIDRAGRALAAADEYDAVEVGGAAGLERELRLERAAGLARRGRGDEALARADDHANDALGEERGLEAGDEAVVEAVEDEDADLAADGGVHVVRSEHGQVLGALAMVGRDGLGDRGVDRGGDLRGQRVVDLWDRKAGHE